MSELNTIDTDSTDLAPAEESRLVARYNYLLLLTRRRKMRFATIRSDEHKHQQTPSSKSNDSAESSTHSRPPSTRKVFTCLQAFNKCLKFRTKSQTQIIEDGGVPSLEILDSPRSEDINHQPSVEHNVSVTVHAQHSPTEPLTPPANAETAAVVITPTSSTDPISASAASNMYCTSVSDAADDPLRTELANQTTADWLNSLHPAEATVYRARIAMNPMGWYRGAMTRERAQQLLQNQPNGSFLVRDSQTAGCHFTLSFRSAGITLHYRIECAAPAANGFWVIESYRNVSLVGLIEHAQQLSRDQILCYVKPSSQLQQPFPVRLTRPISKRAEVPSLQHVCRFVIRRHLREDVIAADPTVAMHYGKIAAWLPAKLQDYVRQKAFLGKHIGYFET